MTTKKQGKYFSRFIPLESNLLHSLSESLNVNRSGIYIRLSTDLQFMSVTKNKNWKTIKNRCVFPDSSDGLMSLEGFPHPIFLRPRQTDFLIVWSTSISIFIKNLSLRNTKYCICSTKGRGDQMAFTEI